MAEPSGIIQGIADVVVDVEHLIVKLRNLMDAATTRRVKIELEQVLDDVERARADLAQALGKAV